VGSQPHVVLAQIGLFCDTFIGPRDIKFHRDLDIVFGTVVLRDLELEVAMGSAVTMYIPAFLRDDLREADGQWQLAELRAYWDIPAMMLQFLRTGSRAMSPALQLSRGKTSSPLCVRCHPLPQYLWVTTTPSTSPNSWSNSIRPAGPR
jgi:hypothetical protein